MHYRDVLTELAYRLENNQKNNGNIHDDDDDVTLDPLNEKLSESKV